MKRILVIFFGLIIAGSAFAEHSNIQMIELTPGSSIEIQPAVQTRITCGQGQGGGGSGGGLVRYCKCEGNFDSWATLFLIFMNQEGKEVRKEMLGVFLEGSCFQHVQTDIRCR